MRWTILSLKRTHTPNGNEIRKLKKKVKEAKKKDHEYVTMQHWQNSVSMVFAGLSVLSHYVLGNI